MDTWGYSFRLGSSRRWFYEDAEDARSWLIEQNLIDENNQPRGCLRGQFKPLISESDRRISKTQYSGY